jgi:hypothetical protein
MSKICRPNGHKIYQPLPLQVPPKFTQIMIFGLKICHLATPGMDCKLSFSFFVTPPFFATSAYLALKNDFLPRCFIFDDTTMIQPRQVKIISPSGSRCGSADLMGK